MICNHIEEDAVRCDDLKIKKPTLDECRPEVADPGLEPESPP